jgi:hypothetical protein
MVLDDTIIEVDANCEVLVKVDVTSLPPILVVKVPVVVTGTSVTLVEVISVTDGDSLPAFNAVPPPMPPWMLALIRLRTILLECQLYVLHTSNNRKPLTKRAW